MDARVSNDSLGVAHSWGDGPEVIFLSNPLADPVGWSSNARERLLALDYQVTTFEHRPVDLDWRSAVECVTMFMRRREKPVALVGWSQGAAIAQEAALAAEGSVTCIALLASYGRPNEIDTTLQQCWDLLADGGDDLDCLRFAMGLLTAFPPSRLADDEFIRNMRMVEPQWAGRPDREARRRSAAFISTYRNRLSNLANLKKPCLVVGFELDTDTFAARAREVAQAVPHAKYIQLPGLAHAAPITDSDQVWPPVVEFLHRYHPVP